MKYEGVNKEGFDRDARLLNEYFEGKPEGYRDPDYGMTLEDWAHRLADDFGIGHAEIWDMLPEYAGAQA